MTSKEIIKRLKKEGWILEGQTVPHPKKDFTKKTLNSIFKQAGWV